MDEFARRTPDAFAPVRLGFVGCGALTRKHLRALRRIPSIEVVAVADLSESLRERVAEQFEVPGRYAGADELLAHPGLDAVASVVPAPVKAEVALAALGADKHVLFEKPLAGTIEDAERIEEAARRSRGRALMGFHIVFHRLIAEAMELVEAGRVGEVESIHTSWFSPSEAHARRGEGALTDLGSHCFDLWRRFSGAEVERVWAQSIGREEVASVNARMTNGVLATGVFSIRTTHEIEVEVCGTLGRLRVSGQRFDGLELLPLGTTPGALQQRVAYLRSLPRVAMDAVRDARCGGIYMDSIRRQWLHFAEVAQGRAEPVCTAADGKQALAITLAARASARDGGVARPIATEAPAYC